MKKKLNLLIILFILFGNRLIYKKNRLIYKKKLKNYQDIIQSQATQATQTTQAIEIILSKYSSLNQNYLTSHPKNIFQTQNLQDYVNDDEKITIPKNIFQTQKSQDYVNDDEDLKKSQNSWKNTDYNYHFYSDSDMDDFIKNNFSKNVYKAFNLCPVPVLKADLWRYCIIYHYGGIYADMDTILNTNINIFDKKALLIGVPENDTHLCNWIFAAPKKSPILEAVIDLSVKRILKHDFERRDKEHYIHYLTGPGCFTDGFEKWLDLVNLPLMNKSNLRGMYRHYKFEKILYIYDNNYFHKNCVLHNFTGGLEGGWTNNKFGDEKL